MKAIINADIYDFNSYKPGSYVLFDTIIHDIGPMCDFPGAEEIHDSKGALLMPGLIIGHAHLYGAFFRGIELNPYSPETFTQLLKQFFWKFDSELDLDSSYYSSRILGIEHIKSGVTTIFDHHASGRAIRGALEELRRGLCDDTGMRGLFCFETSDRFNIDECIAENLAFAQNKTEKSRGMFGFHASLSLSDKTLSRVSDVLGEIPIHVHIGESLEDEIKCMNENGKRIIHRFDDFGLLNRDSILAHCVNINDSEAEIIAKRGCTVAINPTSNMNTSVGIPDYPLLKRHNIPVIIGNDSLGTNITHDYLNVIYSMHLQQKNCWKFGGSDLLNCIKEIYDYTGRMLNINIGKIEPGYVADMITVPYKIATKVDQRNIFDYLIGGVFSNFHPREVWCDGSLKMKNYETIWDEEKIYSEARTASMKVWKRIGGY